MDCRTLCLEAFVIIASYLIISIPIAGATTIKTYYNGAEMSSGRIENFSTDSLVKRQVSVESGTIRLQVSNGSLSSAIVGVWLYTCGDDEPKQCAGSTPLEYSGNVDESFAWGDVSSGSPGTANLMYFVNVVDGGRSSWIGFWSSVEKESSASYTITENEISEVRIHAQAMDIVSTIQHFINDYGMIPANPAWVSRVAFYSATGLHEIGISDGESFGSGVSSRELSGGVVSSVSSEYSFIFPVVADVNMPLTLHDNPSYYCGNDLCQDGSSGPNLGENSVNCCLDCPCISGYYCDPLGCKSKSAIGLSLYGSMNPMVSNCYESNTVDIPVRVDNAPSAYTVDDSRCILGGSYTACSCSESPRDVFVCEVTVPAQPDCGSGDTVITDNSIRFEISFNDGGSPDSKYIETDFPDITVGSFTCGSYGCERTLDENSDRCCYDCGCSSGYCDYVPGEDVSTGECRQDPSSSGLSVSSMEPTHFDNHRLGGERSVVNMILSKKPDSLSVNGMSCEMDCTSRDVDANTKEECSSSCSISWSELTSTDPEKYNMSLTIDFEISGYNPLLEYALSPSITMDIQYVNGSLGNVQRTLERALPTISIGSHWCGDGECTSDESHLTCCFDCPCPDEPQEQYCDTQDIAAPGDLDMCKPAVFDITVDVEPGSFSLEDTSVSQHVPFTIDIGSFPTGGQVTPDCELAYGNVEGCDVYCEWTGEGYLMDCELTIPAMAWGGSEYYAPGPPPAISFGGNTLTVELSYNDGNKRSSSTVGVDLGNVVVTVTSHCGEGGCESDLGEDSNTCCWDCGCPGEDTFCLRTTDDLNGVCVSTDTIIMDIENTEPNPWQCLIGRFGGKCIFVNKHIVNLKVTNPPSDLVIVDAAFSVGNGEPQPEEGQPMDCVETTEPGRWDCAFVPEDMTGSEGTSNVNLSVFASLSYLAGGEGEVPIVQDYSASREFQVERKDSQYLASCKKEIERLEKQLERLKTNIAGYDDYGWMYYVLGVMHIAMGWYLIKEYKACMTAALSCGYFYAVCAAECPPLLIMGIGMIATGGLYIVLGAMSSDSGASMEDLQVMELEDLIQQKKDICSSESFDDILEHVGNIEPMSPVVYG